MTSTPEEPDDSEAQLPDPGVACPHQAQAPAGASPAVPRADTADDGAAEDDVNTANDPPARWRWQWLLREVNRSTLASAIGAGAAIGTVAVITFEESNAGNIADGIVLFASAYLPVYLVLTIAAFAKAPDHALRAWAAREGRGSWQQRYVFGTAPGPGVGIGVGTIALVVAVLWLPQTINSGSALPGGARIVMALVVLASAWATVVVSFAVAYHADNLFEDKRGLSFPGQSDPAWMDYVYFALGVSATAGTTDTSVTSTAMRRTVAVHTVLAFVFNTVILAGVVGFLVSL